MRRYVLHTFATTHSPLMKKRALRYMLASDCPLCHGKRLRPESLAVTFAGIDIAELSRLPLNRLASLLHPHADGTAPQLRRQRTAHPEQALVTARIAGDLVARLKALLVLVWAIWPSTAVRPRSRRASCSVCGWPRSSIPICLASCMCSTSPRRAFIRPIPRRCWRRSTGLKRAGNSLFVVEHEIEIMRHADWLVDVGPAAGQHGGEILYSGPPEGLREVRFADRRYLFATQQVDLDTAPRSLGLAAAGRRHAQ